ncbi:MAG: hypothetical protein CMJ35_00225 [Phycisphaerae bacterium]|nr:hypothetical protein [Phycisphaerae bacterium]MBM90025.1 hypothetical protein [Phycisphaerae bacterium]
MIVLRPDEVRFDGAVWGGVVRVSIDRLSARTIEGYDEEGAYATLVDVARQRIVVRVTQEIEGSDLDAPVPGSLGELVLIAGSGSEIGRKRVSCDCVVESVLNKVSDYGATRSIVLIAQSDAGDADPVEVESV